VRTRWGGEVRPSLPRRCDLGAALAAAGDAAIATSATFPDYFFVAGPDWHALECGRGNDFFDVRAQDMAERFLRLRLEAHRRQRRGVPGWKLMFIKCGVILYAFLNVPAHPQRC